MRFKGVLILIIPLCFPAAEMRKSLFKKTTIENNWISKFKTSVWRVPWDSRQEEKLNKEMTLLIIIHLGFVMYGIRGDEQ